MNGCVFETTLPVASSDSDFDVPRTTATPLSIDARNSDVSATSSASTRLRTCPSGLSGHSAAYTIGPR